MVSTLRVGCRVQAAIGHLTDRRPGERRRRRAKWTGTIIASAPDQKWTVFWEQINKAFDHTPRTLSLIATQPLPSSLDVDAILRNNHLGLYCVNVAKRIIRDQQRERRGNRQVLNVTGGSPNDPPPNLDPNATRTENIQDDPQDEATNNLIVANNRDFDFNDVENEINSIHDYAVNSDDDEDSQDEALQVYLTQKRHLQGETVTVASRSNRLELTWTVRSDIGLMDTQEKRLLYSPIGIQGFDFNQKPIQYGPQAASRRINFLSLLIHLWPGDWHEQLKK